MHWMLYIPVKTVLLSLVYCVAFVSAFLNQQLILAVFGITTHAELFSHIFAGLAVCGQVLFFFKLNEQSASRNKRCFATGAVTLTLVSIIASVSIVAASLQSPNLEQIMDEAIERVNASHLQATLRETERQKQRITEVDERFDKRERRIKSELLPDIKKLSSLIEIEKGVTFQSGPNKGSSLGPRMVILQDRLVELNMELKARMSELDIERNSELKLLAQQLRDAQAFLDNRRDAELVEITPDLYKEKMSAKSRLILGVTNACKEFGLSFLNYMFWAVFISVLLAMALELMLFGLTRAILELRQSIPA